MKILNKIKQLFYSIDSISLIRVEIDRFNGINIYILEIDMDSALNYLFQIRYIHKTSFTIDILFVNVLFIAFQQKVMSIFGYRIRK